MAPSPPEDMGPRATNIPEPSAAPSPSPPPVEPIPTSTGSEEIILGIQTRLTLDFEQPIGVPVAIAFDSQVLRLDDSGWREIDLPEPGGTHGFWGTTFSSHSIAWAFGSVGSESDDQPTPVF